MASSMKKTATRLARRTPARKCLPSASTIIMRCGVREAALVRLVLGRHATQGQPHAAARPPDRAAVDRVERPDHAALASTPDKLGHRGVAILGLLVLEKGE